VSDWRVLHGDCVQVLKELDAGSIDAVVTDPPYPEINRSYGRMTEADWRAMMDALIVEVRRVLTPTGSAVFILQPNQERIGRSRPWLWRFMADYAESWNLVQPMFWWNHTAMPTAASASFGLCRDSIKPCVWLGPPDCYRKQEEILWTESERNAAQRATARCERTYHPSGHNKNPAKQSGAALRRGGVTPFNVWPIANASVVESRDGGAHPARTPLALADKWVRYICPPGGTVLDPFNGSGTMGVAAVASGRNYIGIEQHEEWVNVARDRIARVTPAIFGVPA
jgi:DNA modification methylase